MLVDADHLISGRSVRFVRHVSPGAAGSKCRGEAVDRSGNPHCEYRDRAPAGPQYVTRARSQNESPSRRSRLSTGLSCLTAKHAGSSLVAEVFGTSMETF